MSPKSTPPAPSTHATTSKSTPKTQRLVLCSAPACASSSMPRSTPQNTPPNTPQDTFQHNPQEAPLSHGWSHTTTTSPPAQAPTSAATSTSASLSTSEMTPIQRWENESIQETPWTQWSAFAEIDISYGGYPMVRDGGQVWHYGSLHEENWSMEAEHGSVDP